MIRIKKFIWVLTGMILSFPIFAINDKIITCKHFSTLEIKKIIKELDQQFQWENPNCKIIGTKSIFPRKNKTGIVQFEKGLQLFIYQNNQLKFICLPGWECKSW